MGSTRAWLDTFWKQGLQKSQAESTQPPERPTPHLRICRPSPARLCPPLLPPHLGDPIPPPSSCSCTPISSPNSPPSQPPYLCARRLAVAPAGPLLVAIVLFLRLLLRRRVNIHLVLTLLGVALPSGSPPGVGLALQGREWRVVMGRSFSGYKAQRWRWRGAGP